LRSRDEKPERYDDERGLGSAWINHFGGFAAREETVNPRGAGMYDEELLDEIREPYDPARDAR